MPRVHTTRANKDYPEHGIKKGETYYWYKKRYGGRFKSKTYPRRSALTSSEYLSTLYDLEDGFSLHDWDTPEELAERLEEVAGEVRELGEEQAGRLMNMPESLQDTSPAAELLTERCDACETLASELEDCANEIRALDEDDPDNDDWKQEAEQIYSGADWGQADL